MNVASLIAASRLVAQERAVAVTATNLANVSTPGFQASRMHFSDWLSPQSGGGALPGEPKIAYTQDRATWRDTQQGTLSQTGNPFDLALRNGGYFTVATSRGPRLTRDGRFGLLPDGTVADAAGNALLDTNGRALKVSIGDTRISITADGALSSENGQLGKIGVVTPTDPKKLQAEGGTLFRAETPTTQAAQPAILQGAIESSNVAPVMEVTRMMVEVRDFQLTTQLVQAEDDRIQSTIDKILGRNL